MEKRIRTKIGDIFSVKLDNCRNRNCDTTIRYSRKSENWEL